MCTHPSGYVHSYSRCTCTCAWKYVDIQPYSNVFPKRYPFALVKTEWKSFLLLFLFLSWPWQSVASRLLNPLGSVFGLLPNIFWHRMPLLTLLCTGHTSTHSFLPHSVYHIVWSFLSSKVRSLATFHGFVCPLRALGVGLRIGLGPSKLRCCSGRRCFACVKNQVFAVAPNGESPTWSDLGHNMRKKPTVRRVPCHSFASATS